LLKKLAGINYFIALIILLILIFVLGFAAFILVAYFPGALGAAPPHLEIKEIYEFEPWSFEIDSLSASFPAGGMIMPIFRDNKQEAVLIIGQGEYGSQARSIPEENPTGLYLDIDVDLFNEIRGDTIFVPVEDINDRETAMHIYKQQQGLPIQWQRGIPLVFYPGGEAMYYYFLDASGRPYLPPVIVEPDNNVTASIVLYALFITVLLLTILAFSLEHHHSRYWKFIHCARPQWPVPVAALGAAGFAFIGELLPSLYELPEISMALGYAAAAGALILLAKMKWIDFLDFGLRRETVKYGYIIVVIVAVLFIVVTRGFPGKLALNGLSSLADFLMLFFLVALAREVIWRGFIQVALGRSFGPIVGLILTAALAGLVHYATLAAAEPWLLDYPYTIVETLILAPGTALVLGFIYMRTENILSSTALHCLILFLPRLIIH